MCGARRADERRKPTRLPVVPVHHVVTGAGQRRPAQSGVAQKGESLGAVRVVPTALAVEAFPVEVARLVDEDRAHAVVRDREDARIQIAVPEPYRNAARRGRRR